MGRRRRPQGGAFNVGVMHRSILASLLILPFLAACHLGALFLDGESAEIWKQMKAKNYDSIDFSSLAGPAWTKVCFYGPYSESEEGELGFKWRVSDHTDVLTSDGHNVIVFATDSKVISYIVHPRAYGDFAKLSGNCLPRSSARMVREPSEAGWKSYVAKIAEPLLPTDVPAPGASPLLRGGR